MNSPRLRLPKILLTLASLTNERDFFNFSLKFASTGSRTQDLRSPTNQVSLGPFRLCLLVRYQQQIASSCTTTLQSHFKSLYQAYLRFEFWVRHCSSEHVGVIRPSSCTACTRSLNPDVPEPSYRTHVRMVPRIQPCPAN